MIDESVFTARGRYNNPLPLTLQPISIDPRLTLTFYLPPTCHAYVVPAASVWSSLGVLVVLALGLTKVRGAVTLRMCSNTLHHL